MYYLLSSIGFGIYYLLSLIISTLWYIVYSIISLMLWTFNTYCEICYSYFLLILGLYFFFVEALGEHSKLTKITESVVYGVLGIGVCAFATAINVFESIQGFFNVEVLTLEQIMNGVLEALCLQSYLILAQTLALGWNNPKQCLAMLHEEFIAIDEPPELFQERVNRVKLRRWREKCSKLRFSIDDAVLVNMETGWAAGTVIGLWDYGHSYRVRLNNDIEVWADIDKDVCIKTNSCLVCRR